MRATLRALVLFTAVCSMAPAPSAMARPLQDVKSSGTLRVAVYNDYKPWSWEENGALKGIDVDIGAALGRALGVKVDFRALRAADDVYDPTDGDLLNGVVRGPVTGGGASDVMLHVPHDPKIAEDNDKVKLTAPYQTESLAMAVDPAKADAAKDFSLFEREKVAVDLGSLADVILLSARDHKLIDNVVHVRGESGAVEAYDKGEVVAFYGEAALVEALARRSTRPAVIIYPRDKLARDWLVGGAVKADSADLGDAIDRAIAAMAKSGELKRIFASYGVAWRPPPQEN
ncbi:ABC transporter substrate-binding protein [Rhodoblastus acidophilus]|uniref:ABC transporter substrate-binding protein n=1 Tax=Candidatus Rhodoblastus alkanivorans TaxID=2954117 RepID=A0ABS9Z4Z0_9HYPH|nr:ABC transporter substrate-binding protein [Candidatus Rhodoblastus alkanivorans]MCI4679899.1 ABC transporter substrate-binding protein [Candidatus Rhodoblastus alkanivorans]MCI4682698.1 ABC transporter substrate-binding protein [Candidatus Rhodoblastus alkanivorans]MDI4640005.1 ABC transporter substrate-binding protein [Rhodoblastus acidophilus]